MYSMRHAARLAVVLFVALVLPLTSLANVLRVTLEEGATVALRNGRLIVLECRPPAKSAEAFFKKFLNDPDKWEDYSKQSGVAVRFSDLNAKTQRAALLAVFPEDYVDEKGWHHTAVSNDGEKETLWAIAEWLTGAGTNHEKLSAINPGTENGILELGQQILIPPDLLLDVMKEITPERIPAVEEMPAAEGEELDLGALAKELEFKARGRKNYAVYRLKKGEALYTSVVVRFTDIRENVDILAACDVLQKESEITDVRDMDPGTEIWIPMEMLADRFKPESNPDRQEFEAMLAEADRLRGQVQSKDLEGVVVILDPGHGGRDQGTRNVTNGFTIYEDEAAYDIVCRIKAILETQTRAKVYVTMLDPDQQYGPVDLEQFEEDDDELVLVTPNYRNHDAKVSANLRWYLANSIYRKEVNGGADPRKVIFTSIHMDALFNGKLRGTMVYIPGAAHRRESERGGSMATYGQYAEVQEAPEAKSTASERRRDEALSRNFAATLLDELGKQRIKRHSVGDPIRNVIRQSGGKQYVPSVLRNTMVPTKVLVECANLTNETDSKWITQPWWRQRFAEAYVNALKAYYK